MSSQNTHDLPCAVYMGAPNFDEFAPAPGSYINTDDFDSPKALADYLKIVGNNTSSSAPHRSTPDQRNVFNEHSFFCFRAL
jgi:hypothetical protein